MKAKYKIQFNKKYLKDLEKIPIKFRKKIEEKILELAIDPRPNDCKKLKGNEDDVFYRIRSGDYRIVYAIKDNVLLIIIIEVGHRREIYR